MNIYIDVEFNELGGELISMALVADNDEQWYEVVECKNPKPWVKDHVIPVLGKPAINLEYFKLSLAYFLNQFKAVHLIADWPQDIQYFCEALIVGPGKRLDTPALTMEIKRNINSNKSKISHNALSDAVAIKECDHANL